MAASLLLLAVTALADRPSTDHDTAVQILAKLRPDAGISANKGADAGIPMRPLLEAENALSRAKKAHAAGDAVNARLLEGLAREWAELAQDVSTAAQIDRDAAAVQVAVANATLQAERTRAHIDELTARKARALGRLDHQESADGGPERTPGNPRKIIASPATSAPAGGTSRTVKPAHLQGDGGRR